jgi:hypothetical protein
MPIGCRSTTICRQVPTSTRRPIRAFATPIISSSSPMPIRRSRRFNLSKLSAWWLRLGIANGAVMVLPREGLTDGKGKPLHYDKAVDVDLESVEATGPGGTITRTDVERAAKRISQTGCAEPLRGMRRAMAQRMTAAHAQNQLVSVTVPCRSCRRASKLGRRLSAIWTGRLSFVLPIRCGLLRSPIVVRAACVRSQGVQERDEEV